MKVWCFRGAKDDAVAASQQMVDAIRKYNPDVKFTIYPNANHNCWDTTYNNDVLYTWLLTQKRFTFKKVLVPVDVLKRYARTYTDKENDTLKIVFQDGNLLLSNGRDKPEDQVKIMPFSDSNFFIAETLMTEIDGGKLLKLYEERNAYFWCHASSGKQKGRYYDLYTGQFD